MHSKPEHEHKHARNGSAITAWFCNMHIRNNLVMPRARPYNAETAMNRNNDKNKSTNSNEKNNKNNNNNGPLIASSTVYCMVSSRTAMANSWYE